MPGLSRNCPRPQQRCNRTAGSLERLSGGCRALPAGQVPAGLPAVGLTTQDLPPGCRPALRPLWVGKQAPGHTNHRNHAKPTQPASSAVGVVGSRVPRVLRSPPPVQSLPIICCTEAQAEEGCSQPQTLPGEGPAGLRGSEPSSLGQGCSVPPMSSGQPIWALTQPSCLRWAH